MKNLWNDESGVLTFEWILLITLLVIGIVGGLAAVRDAYIVKAADTAAAMTAVKQDYKIQASITNVGADGYKVQSPSGNVATTYDGEPAG